MHHLYGNHNPRVPDVLMPAFSKLAGVRPLGASKALMGGQAADVLAQGREIPTVWGLGVRCQGKLCTPNPRSLKVLFPSKPANFWIVQEWKGKDWRS